MAEFFVDLIVPFMSAAAGAGLTAYLALGQFKHQKQWEVRLSAYLGILDSLYQMRSYTDAILNADAEEDILPLEEEASLLENYKQGREQIWKAVVVGGLTLPQDVLSKIREILRGLGDVPQETDYIGAVIHDSQLLSTGITKFISSARNDLGIEGSGVSVPSMVANRNAK